MARAIKGENGVLIVNKREIDERWRRFFEYLCNVEGVAEERWRDLDLLEDGREEEWLITEEEMMVALKGMKSGKAAGEDGIVAETVSYTHLRAHETPEHLVCRLLLEKK